MNNSRYGTLFNSKNGNTYFYDSGTGKILTGTYKEIELIRNILNNHITIEKASTLNKEFGNFIKKEHLFSLPEKTKFYIPKKEELKKFLIGNCSQIIIELTERCNFRCGYCIYNEKHPKFRGFGEQDMSFEIAKKALDFVLNGYKKDEFFLTFYGGEPLLKFNLMKECIEYVRNSYSDIKLGISFTTNLTLLDKKMIDYFCELSNAGINVNIMCSIDGPDDIHDRFRRYSNGRTSFEDVIRKFKLLLKYFYEKDNLNRVISINCVISPPCDDEKIKKIRDFFEKELNLPKGIKYSLGYVDADGGVFDYFENKQILLNELNQKSINIGDSTTKKILKTKSTKIDRNDFNIMLNSFTAVYRRELYDKPNNNKKNLHGNCIPGEARLYVTCNGDFLPCERVGETPYIGNINMGLDYDVILNKYFIEYANHYETKCNECWAQKMCNICYARNMSKFGVNEPDYLCDEMKMEAKRKLVNYYNILEDNEELLKEAVSEIIV